MGGKENGERGGDHRKESGDTPWEAAGESSSSSFSWTSLGISQQPPVPSGEGMLTASLSLHCHHLK